MNLRDQNNKTTSNIFFLLGLLSIVAALLIIILKINIDTFLITAVASIIFVIFFIIFKNFQIGFTLLMFILPFEDLLGVGGGGSFTRYLMIINFLGGLLQKTFLKSTGMKFSTDGILKVFFIFIIWIFVTSFWSVYPEYTFVAATACIGNFILLYSVLISNIEWLVIYWSSIILGSLFSVSLVSILPRPQGLENDPERFTTGGQDPNDLAGLLLISVGVGMYGIYPKIKSKIGKISLIFILCSLVVGVVLTQSRTGLIALLILLITHFSNFKKKSIYIYYLLFGISLFLVYFFAGDIISNFMSDYGSQIFVRFNQADNNTLAEARLNVWEATIEAIKRNFLLGVGAGNMPYVIDDYSIKLLPRSTYDPNKGLVAHNMILGIWGETGFIGLIIFLSMFFIAFKQALTIANKNDLGKAMSIALFVVCIMGMSLSWENKKIVYVILGTISALWRYRNNNQNNHLRQLANVRIN